MEEQSLWYEQELLEEIDRDREAHGKKPLKEEKAEEGDDERTLPNRGKGEPNRNTSKKKQARQKKEKHVKKSTSDPEAGWFRKGEHKNVFAYSVQTVCDINGVILGYSVHPGNENDSKTFPAVFEKIEELDVELVVGDSAYKTPAIAKYLNDHDVKLLSTYSRPKTKEGFFPKREYVYDEQYDCYLCPADQVLSNSTTNRDGYREYKSDPKVCAQCPYLSQYTQSKTHEKVVTRHVWQEYLEEADENRYTYGISDHYKYRKETIERDFGLAKELHGFRYTQEFGKARMEVKVALTYACMNLKKLAAVFKIFCKRANCDAQKISGARGHGQPASTSVATATAAWPWQVAGEMLKWQTDGKALKPVIPIAVGERSIAFPRRSVKAGVNRARTFVQAQAS